MCDIDGDGYVERKYVFDYEGYGYYREFSLIKQGAKLIDSGHQINVIINKILNVIFETKGKYSLYNLFLRIVKVVF